MDKVGNLYTLCMLGDLDRWIGDRVRAGVTGAFGVLGENENWRGGVEFCAERGLLVTYFEHKSLHKYTRVARDQDRVEVKSMIYLVLVKMDMLHFVQDCDGSERNGRGHLRSPVLCKVRFVGTWIKRREVVDEARMIRSKKLIEPQYREGYAWSLEGKRVE